LINVLQIRSFEVAKLFGFNLQDIPRLLDVFVRLNRSIDLGTILQEAVNDIVYEMG